jgi:hypothetical protein
MDKRKSIVFKIAILALTVCILGTFWFSGKMSDGQVRMTVMPVVPKEGEPMLVTFTLTNPSPQPLKTGYEFFANGRLIAAGDNLVPEFSATTHQYLYPDSPDVGEQVNFVVRSRSALGDSEEAISLPSYPSQVLLSMVSISSIATSAAGLTNSISYYRSTVGDMSRIKLSSVLALVLVILLVFAELVQPLQSNRLNATIGRLRVKFSSITWILFIIFMGILYTNITLIISGLSLL